VKLNGRKHNKTFALGTLKILGNKTEFLKSANELVESTPLSKRIYVMSRSQQILKEDG